MGDRVTIPRSFAGTIGVADVQNSLRRHYFPVPLRCPNNNTTTGIMFGGDSNTTGIPFFERNITFEKVYAVGFKRTTVNAETTLLTVQVFKNGVSTVAAFTIDNSTTLGERVHAGSTNATIANLISTDKLSVRIPTRNQMTRLSVVCVFCERVDS
jgi:hypothetical protein